MARLRFAFDAGKWALYALLALPSSASAFAQNGDRKGETQEPIDRNFEVPPAPALTPAQALASFDLVDGYRIECVAAEPLVRDPVDIVFDAQGRLWSIEMNTLMLDADATGELEPKSCIAMLEDTDHDGVFDKRTEFANDLVLPRSICFVEGGILAILPPQIVYLSDTDGDGEVDVREVVDEGIQAGLSNPEHAANSLTRGIDNWIYLANHGKRYRRVAGEWLRESVPALGQWGMGQDEWGRRIYNYNSAPVHGDLVPTHYLVRNSKTGRAHGSNARWAHSTEVYTARLNTGVNRGYQNNTLLPSGHLARYTAACGPAVFTGVLLAPEDHGSVFVCEPSGNFVRKLSMSEVDGRPTAKNAYAMQKTEFLRSTDERFRPVNLRNGPDGALYIVDLYRGILQHRVFLTSFLRRQIEERGLDKHTGMGRIWRVVHDSHAEESLETIDLTKLDSLQLVEQFYEPNAWSRLTAQHLLIDSRTSFSVDQRASLLARLEQVSADTSHPFAQLHALWTLEGLGKLPLDFLLERIGIEQHPKLLAQLIRLSEVHVQDFAVLEAWQWLLDHDAVEVRWQLAHSLGESGHSAARGQLVQLLLRNADDAVLRTGVWSSIAGAEGALLRELLVHPLARQSPKRVHTLAHELAKLLGKSADSDSIAQVVQCAAGQANAACQLAVLEGLVAGLPRQEGDKKYRFQRQAPLELAGLAAHSRPRVRKLAEQIQVATQWAEASAESQLSEELQAAYARGLEVYTRSCGTCHQADGEGLAGLAPPLQGSEWLARPTAELANIALYGLSGPIEVRGESWDMNMPGWNQLSDEELADVLSFILVQWGPESRHVLASELATARRQAH